MFRDVRAERAITLFYHEVTEGLFGRGFAPINTDTDVLVRRAKTAISRLLTARDYIRAERAGTLFYHEVTEGRGRDQASLLWLFIKNTQQFLPSVQLNIMAVR